mmetsp:Transcript_19834/g.35888  ORF Transcript_19834/g.35888 Transcript_19834/m.35888 type:complete len:161 (-) Transcript_19834:130-612(-)
MRFRRLPSSRPCSMLENGTTKSMPTNRSNRHGSMHHFQQLMQGHCHRAVSPPLSLCSSATLHPIQLYAALSMISCSITDARQLYPSKLRPGERSPISDRMPVSAVSLRLRRPLMLVIGSSFVSLSNSNDSSTLSPSRSQKVVQQKGQSSFALLTRLRMQS